jgi:hypothetical protein
MNNIRSIYQIVTDKISSAYATSIQDEEDDTLPILPVTNAFDHVNKLRKLIAYFDNAYETLHNFNIIENLLYSKHIRNVKQIKINYFFNQVL